MTAHLNKYYIVCDLKYLQNKIHPNFEKHRDHFTCSSLITPGLLQHTFYLAELKIYKLTPDCRRSKLSCQACTTRRWDHINLVLASLQWLQVCFGVQDCSDNFKIPSWFTSALRLVPFTLVRTLPSSGRGHLFVLLAQLKTKGERTFTVRAQRL